MRNDDEASIHMRRLKVSRMTMMGIPRSIMSEKLKWSESTIQRDIDHNRNAVKKLLEKYQKETAEFIIDALDTFIAAKQEAWKMFEAQKNPSVKMGALKTVVDVQKSQVDVMIRLGIIDTIADEININLRNNTDFDEETLKEMGAFLVERENRKALDEEQ
jgi:tRNA A37 threonylcarbamoyladenosine dehydratase